MSIGDFYRRGEPTFSFEFFPPKNQEGVEALLRTVADLREAVNPDFVSVTYGAGGSTRARTLECVTRIQTEAGIPTVAHLAAMGHTRDQLAEVVRGLVDSGITRVLALRGDRPKDGSAPPPTDLAHATDLMEFLATEFPEVEFGGACYPEVHPEAASAVDDMRWTRHKHELGAGCLITQVFFDNADFFRFRDAARDAGIGCPIVPGIMPITNVAQIERITRLCGSRFPDELHERLDAVREDPAAVMAIGMEHSIKQCRQLLREDAPGLHFYTLNKSLATRVILAALRG
ncbi:MAG: methylenetetrahydrofolate reductase [NAD(P)H] [Bryobacteraceae bacterium]